MASAKRPPEAIRVRWNEPLTRSKGPWGDMAAPEAFEAARSLEQMAREGILDGVGPALANLEGAIDRLLPELQRFQPGAG